MKRREFLTGSVMTLSAATLPQILLAQRGRGAGAAPPRPVFVPPDDQLDPLDAIDPVAPKGLKPNASPDARFPVSYQRSVPAGFRVMTAHFHAIGQRDYKLLAKTLHFPSAIVERVDTVVLNTPADLTDEKAPATWNFYPDGGLARQQSRLNVGAYDLMTNLEVISFDAVSATMAMTFDRYNKQGFRTLRNEGVYCVTNNDGRWAIQMASTIWKPADFIGKVFPDAEAAAIRLRANHTDSYINDLDIIDHPRPNRGPHAGVQGASPAGRGGNQMEGYKIKGVTSRLTVNTNDANPKALSPDPRDRINPRTEPKWAPEPRSWSQVGIDDWWESRIAPDYRIIHSFSDKVHRYAGAARYNAAGELLNISMEVAIVVLGSGTDWTQTGGMRYLTTHDRLNDEMN